MALVKGVVTTFTPTGTTKQFAYYVPVDWDVNDRWSLLHVGFCGDGETTAASARNMPPMKQATDGWNGKVYLNNGNIAKFAILQCPNHSTDYAAYRIAILHMVTELGMDTTSVGRFSMSGYSGGPPRAYLTLRNYNDVAFIFQRTVNMSTGGINGTTGGFITSLTAKGFHHVWHSMTDTVTDPAYSQTLFGYFKGSRRSLTITIDPQPHNQAVWNEVMNIRGVGVSTGGTAHTQDGGRWRYLADPFDGVGAAYEVNGILTI